MKLMRQGGSHTFAELEAASKAEDAEEIKRMLREAGAPADHIEEVAAKLVAAGATSQGLSVEKIARALAPETPSEASKE